jgi:hypothetical protein
MELRLIILSTILHLLRNLDRDIEGSSKRWKKIVEADWPEREKLPQEWKSKTGAQKLCIQRALRPDRMVCDFLTPQNLSCLYKLLTFVLTSNRRIRFLSLSKNPWV